MNFLEIKGLKKSFGQGESHIDVLKGIDSLDEGELIINKHRLKTMKEKELSQYRRDHLGYKLVAKNL
ncbi:MAG: hypothetical protein UDR60_06885 [Catenibacterium mitsuokai]|nr:hypothetical protein [Catenibacterium mitsuokai]MEE0334629.1 hypothetical protein [Catenibacterium mitsuokai]